MTTLPQGWADTTIGAVTLPIVSIDPTNEPNTEFRYVDIGSIDKSTQTIGKPKTFLGQDAPSRARRVIHEGDVLFSTVRTYLKNIAAVPEHLDGALTSTGIAVLRASAVVDSRYLFNWVCSGEFVDKMSGAQDGTLYPAVSDKVVSSASIPLPPFPEQRRIVAKVDGLTARTARARKELSYLPTLIARYKQRLLTLAGDGTLTQRWREENAAADWSPTTVLDVASHTFDGPFGSNLKSVDYAGKGVRVVRLENIGNLRFIGEKETYISEAKFKTLKRHKLEPGDVLFSSFIAEEIRVCEFPDDLPTAAINKADCFCVRPDVTKCLSSFLAYRLASPKSYDKLKEAVHGATRPRISLTHLKKYEFELPSLDEQAEIIRRIDSAFLWLDRMVADHAAAARLLPKLEAAILAKAFRGKLVPQNPDDEPANILLERVMAERVAAPKEKRSPKARVLKLPKEFNTMAKNLEETLAEAGDWMSAQDAFKRCGIGSGASTEEIELLYAEVRRLDKEGKLEAEPVNDEHGRKLHDRLRLKAA